MPSTDTDAQKIDHLLDRNVEDVFVKDELKNKLLSGKQLRIKLGFDPTGPHLHIGRAVVLRKLRDFQKIGHKAVFIVGDFTALIGDPSDKLGKRPMLTKEDIKKNLETYKTQVGKIIDLKRAEFYFNSRWLKKLAFKEIIELAESFSVNQMLARRTFKERVQKEEEISLREFLYPLMQGYDSVEVRADVEIGGFDQLFNLKAGRNVQKHYNKPEQDVLTTSMLEGLDGRKMSTSWGNVVNITDEPNDMFGKLMSLKDGLMEKYFLLCTDLSKEEVKKILQTSPRDAKIKLAYEIVKIYHGSESADAARDYFTDVFSKKEAPSDVKLKTLGHSSMPISQILLKAGFVESRSEARRLIKQKGVRIDGDLVLDSESAIDLKKERLIQVGKRRFLRIVEK